MPAVASRGSGPLRDLCIAYLDGASAAISLDPTAIVLTDNGPAFSNWYGQGPGRGIASYPDVVQQGRDIAAQDGATLNRVILIGFSEGCQAIRTHAMDGWFADGNVAADGVHSAIPPEADKQRAWQVLIDHARDGGAPFATSHSSIVTEPSYNSTRATLSLLTGQTLPSGDTITQLAEYTSGNLTVLSYGGTTGPAHVAQVTDVLPLLLQRVLSQAQPGMGSGAGSAGRSALRWLALGVGLVGGVLGAQAVMED